MPRSAAAHVDISSSFTKNSFSLYFTTRLMRDALPMPARLCLAELARRPPDTKNGDGAPLAADRSQLLARPSSATIAIRRACSALCAAGVSVFLRARRARACTPSRAMKRMISLPSELLLPPQQKYTNASGTITAFYAHAHASAFYAPAAPYSPRRNETPPRAHARQDCRIARRHDVTPRHQLGRV